MFKEVYHHGWIKLLQRLGETRGYRRHVVRNGKKLLVDVMHGLFDADIVHDAHLFVNFVYEFTADIHDGFADFAQNLLGQKNLVGVSTRKINEVFGQPIGKRAFSGRSCSQTWYYVR